MKHYAYLCGDPGIPVPGLKGASIHVESVCRALGRRGLSGEIHAVRAEGERCAGVPVYPIRLPPRRKRKSVEEREARLFLASLGSVFELDARPDFIYERYSLWHVGGLARARELEVPYVLEVNSPLPEEASRFRSLGNPSLAEGIAQILLKEADAIVCVSDEVARWVSGRRGHGDGVWCIPNGVDPDVFRPAPGSRPPPLPPRDTPLIAFCGSFRPWHGLEDLLAALTLLRRELPTVQLVCVGDGPLRMTLEEQARELGLASAVHFTGQLPQHEVAHWIGGADVAVAPYPDLENFYFSPLKIFEFLALGLPVVASAIGQVSELLPDGERGFLCPPGQPAALAARLTEVLAHPARARTVATAGRDWVLAHATWDARVATLLERIARLP